ncbi:MAG TPA: hypothetical protein VEZ90_06640 [Blastocatellia bacterium]|nr:hypothetical protein [Blastocatellia bacterium]
MIPYNTISYWKLAEADGSPGDDPHADEMPKITREYGLLVKDQDILDLIWKSTRSEIYVLAERVLAIQDAIDAYDIRAITAVAESVAKESGERGFRKLVKAIKQGVMDGETWCAGFTTRVLLSEAFSKTPEYFRAQREFFDELRMNWRRSH